MDPSQRAYEEDLAGGAFQRGVAFGKWRVISGDWPNPLIAVSAGDRPDSPTEFVLRFDLTDYPERAPTAQMWDVEKGGLLAHGMRPRGTENIQKAFRVDWQPALYIPCDRVALESHAQWRDKQGAWKPGHDLTHYLRFVHDLLNSAGYQGAARPAAQA